MKNKSLISLLIGCAFLLASSIAIPFETSESAVSVQLQMVLVDNDGTRINQDVDVKVRLVLASVIGNISIWEKTYTNETIDNGIFYKVIGGLDDNNTELIAEMFDESNVDIELEIEDEVIPINFILLFLEQN